jgi:hypothetical protein
MSPTLFLKELSFSFIVDRFNERLLLIRDPPHFCSLFSLPQRNHDPYVDEQHHKARNNEGND